MSVTFQEGANLNPHLATLATAIDRDLRQGGPPAPRVAQTVAVSIRRGFQLR